MQDSLNIIPWHSFQVVKAIFDLNLITGHFVTSVGPSGAYNPFRNIVVPITIYMESKDRPEFNQLCGYIHYDAWIMCSTTITNFI